MNLLIIGGYGVFGSRLASLLVRDGHDLTVAGRDIGAAQALAQTFGCAARSLDRNGLLDFLKDYDVVIDAAGPFQSYGDDPYRLAKAAIAQRVHYLDLSDDPSFCAGISALDADAKAAGVCVLSGLSSVPAISSAAVTALAGDDDIKVIKSTILPGNRSPRGLSVMEAILRQAGRPAKIWRGKRWTTFTGWSQPEGSALPKGHRRQGWLICVPDLVLFPDHFKADSVLFRARLELGVMRYGLAGFAAAQRLLKVPIGPRLVRTFRFLADLLAPFGSGDGGMTVTVRTQDEDQIWRLLAENGDGPFMPGIPARALLRRETLPIGAAPALGIVTLDEVEAACSDLDVCFDQITAPFRPLFRQIKGLDLDSLPPTLQASHDVYDQLVLDGTSRVDRGDSLRSRCLAWLFRFPEAAEKTPVTVTKTRHRGKEVWVRNFDGQVFISTLTPTPFGTTERFGPITFDLDLHVTDGALHYPVKSARIGYLPLPAWMLPVSEASEYEANGMFHFDVGLYAPLTRQLMVRYRGNLRPITRESDLP